MASWHTILDLADARFEVVQREVARRILQTLEIHGDESRCEVCREERASEMRGMAGDVALAMFGESQEIGRLQEFGGEETVRAFDREQQMEKSLFPSRFHQNINFIIEALVL